jgi:glycosyltransferase involved in cell wall biosynthesis
MPPTRDIATGIVKDSMANQQPASDGPLRLVHAGQLYGGLRDPAVLLRGIRRYLATAGLDQAALRASFLGVDSAYVLPLAHELGLTDVVQAHGEVERDEVVVRLRQAHVLVSIHASDGRDHGALPGKIFEYMATRRPILSVGPRNPPLASLLESTHTGVSVSDEAACAYALAQFDARRKAGLGLVEESPQLETMSSIRTTRRLVDFIETLVGQDGGVT